MIALGNKMKTLFSHNIIPRTSSMMYNETLATTAFPTGTATTKVERPHAWLDCKGQTTATNAIPHYALKGWITDWKSASDSQVNNALRFTFKYYFSVRAPVAAN
jgi:hypothetical protein